MQQPWGDNGKNVSVQRRRRAFLHLYVTSGTQVRPRGNDAWIVPGHYIHHDWIFLPPFDPRFEQNQKLYFLHVNWMVIFCMQRAINIITLKVHNEFLHPSPVIIVNSIFSMAFYSIRSIFFDD